MYMHTWMFIYSDTHMVESEDIMGYLEAQYGIEGSESVKANWADYSTAGATASHGTLPGAGRGGKEKKSKTQ